MSNAPLRARVKGGRLVLDEPSDLRKRGLDFKRNLIVSPFNINDIGKCEGVIQKEDTRLFSIFYQKLTLDEPYLLVYSFENK